MYTSNKITGSALIALGLFTFGASHADNYTRNVSMTEGVQISSISGYAGTIRNLGKEKSDKALTGITTYERRDIPCKASISTENINDSSDSQTSQFKDLCGGDSGRIPLIAQYSDSGLNSTRVFVTGIRVCGNKKSRRIKGYQLFGKRIGDDGALYEIGTKQDANAEMSNHVGNFLGVNSFSTDVFPVAARTNCSSDEFEPWAHCPSPREIAVGVQLHFAAGDQPRALTGIALKCRYLSRLTTSVN